MIFHAYLRQGSSIYWPCIYARVRTGRVPVPSSLSQSRCDPHVRWGDRQRRCDAGLALRCWAVQDARTTVWTGRLREAAPSCLPPFLSHPRGAPGAARLSPKTRCASRPGSCFLVPCTKFPFRRPSRVCPSLPSRSSPTASSPRVSLSSFRWD